MTTAINVASNANFQLIAATEALKTISKDTGIAFESLIAQLPTNKNLMNSVAKMVALAAKTVSKSINEI